MKNILYEMIRQRMLQLGYEDYNFVPEKRVISANTTIDAKNSIYFLTDVSQPVEIVSSKDNLTQNESALISISKLETIKELTGLIEITIDSDNNESAVLEFVRVFPEIKKD